MGGVGLVGDAGHKGYAVGGGVQGAAVYGVRHDAAVCGCVVLCGVVFFDLVEEYGKHARNAKIRTFYDLSKQKVEIFNYFL